MAPLLHIRSLADVKGYCLIRVNREGREGIGNACYIHESLRAHVLHHLLVIFSNVPEFMILDIRSGEFEPLLFTSMYRIIDWIMLYQIGC